jgi:DNA polymerase III sliding clamp (beta) subunit (PCNA family)
MRLDFCLNHEGDEKLIIEVEQSLNEKQGIVNVRLDSEKANFSFLISKKALKKLVVAGIRYLKDEEQGCFNHDKFRIGLGDRQKVFSAKEILSQHPF